MPFELINLVALLLAFLGDGLRFSHDVSAFAGRTFGSDTGRQHVAMRVIVILLMIGGPAHHLCALIREMHLMT